ncbi:MAG: SPOR domain-containing protein [Actinomycetota bacterium]|nr:SPOR domain-containing protein [Actinomycetota bacterium]
MTGRYYWSLNDRRVVTEEDGVKAADRLGPYDTRDEAEHALETVAARNEAWEEEEERED